MVARAQEARAPFWQRNHCAHVPDEFRAVEDTAFGRVHYCLRTHRRIAADSAADRELRQEPG
jgi:hypothetical protein